MRFTKSFCILDTEKYLIKSKHPFLKNKKLSTGKVFSIIKNKPKETQLE